jgi:hypothetical protein
MNIIRPTYIWKILLCVVAILSATASARALPPSYEEVLDYVTANIPSATSEYMEYFTAGPNGLLWKTSITIEMWGDGTFTFTYSSELVRVGGDVRDAN